MSVGGLKKFCHKSLNRFVNVSIVYYSLIIDSHEIYMWGLYDT